MSSKSSVYNAFARFLHWLMAGLIILMLFIGVIMVSISSQDRQALIGLHKTIGVTILILGVVRIFWRLAAPPPPPPAGEPRWRKLVAEATHITIYALILAMPIIGWAMQSAGGYPIAIFGSVYLPPITSQDGELHAVLRAAHRFGAYLFYGLFLLHLSAALFHAFVLEGGTLRRMSFTQKEKAPAE
jgi:cytochrome b561